MKSAQKTKCYNGSSGGEGCKGSGSHLEVSMVMLSCVGHYDTSSIDYSQILSLHLHINYHFFGGYFQIRAITCNMLSITKQ